MTLRKLLVLVTGFEAFGGEPVNPSAELVDWLTDHAPSGLGVQLQTATLPVDRTRLGAALVAALACKPDVVVALGQATGRTTIDLESTAHNGLDFRGQTDNGGHAATHERLEHDGPEQLTTSLALDSLSRELSAAGHPVGLSHDAGRHLCNAVYWDLLRHPDAVPAVFVHVPLRPDQATRRGRGEPSLPEDVTRRCLIDLLMHLPRLMA